MENGKKEKKRKIPVLIILFLAVFVSFLLSFFLGQGGLLKLQQMENEYDRVLRENHRIALENKKLAEEIKRLRHDPKMVEKIAREELYYVSPEDLVLIVPED